MAQIEQPGAQAGIRDCIEAGEEARVVDELPGKFKIADGRIALVALSRTGTTRAAVVRNPVWVAMYQEHFELRWEKATPLVIERGRVVPQHFAPVDGLNTVEAEIVNLVAEGLNDEEISQRLSVQMSKRTVERTLTRLRTMLDAANRTNFVALAGARGWIDTERLMRR